MARLLYTSVTSDLLHTWHILLLLLLIKKWYTLLASTVGFPVTYYLSLCNHFTIQNIGILHFCSHFLQLPIWHLYTCPSHEGYYELKAMWMQLRLLQTKPFGDNIHFTLTVMDQEGKIYITCKMMLFLSIKSWKGVIKTVNIAMQKYIIDPRN